MASSRTILLNKITGEVSVLEAMQKAKRSAESVDLWLTRTEQETLSESPEKEKIERIELGMLPGRGNRGAWRLATATGKVVVDMQLAYTLRRKRLEAEWKHWTKVVDETLGFALGFGDTGAAPILEVEKQRLAAMPALIRTELDRFLADGDEAAMGSWEPNWPNLEV